MNRQTEFILLIIGASFSIITFFAAALYALIFGFSAIVLSGSPTTYGGSEEMIMSWIFTFFSIIAVIFTVASAVFGFIGAFKIKNNSSKVKTIAVCFIVLGGLQVFSIQGILFLIAGILTLTKKEYKTNFRENEGIKWE
ncbi:DUF4064 domain-containing protein [Listeria innocua]|uniref:DUF4064 domain-containing protein n=1 Tax=Listeria innocua TaxID=1642 RepID=UPI001624A247|nr:DUF4064 domain-containing protein [Listeria innocua]EEJ0013622.1 DUF4064 domain-containing protein [Listeria innocua]EEJ1214291.1 DUF4064 domain-containing protein [Listeria innocua]ELY0462939.1 DUF4064 domain-containing protein [Listeria innocua]ELY0486325.1 DUF4064 domain-containing protein [Listeria innocua]ELY0495140.1 DUF4064 domain-containing protein [Listeria innocua]